MTNGALLLFTRCPRPGEAKTRLIPALGPQGAADLMQRLTAHTLARVQAFAVAHGVCLTVYFAGGSRGEMQDRFGPRFCYRPQNAGDLGARMLAALKDSLAAGQRPVVIIGSDCPALSPAILEAAMARLQDHDLVLGPAVDGGYYLIGLKDYHPQLFMDIPWGTAQVLAQTLQAAQQSGLSTALLPILRDIDRPEDLPWLENFRI